jgi:hypothetical protein
MLDGHRSKPRGAATPFVRMLKIQLKSARKAGERCLRETENRLLRLVLKLAAESGNDKRANIENERRTGE